MRYLGLTTLILFVGLLCNGSAHAQGYALNGLQDKPDLHDYLVKILEKRQEDNRDPVAYVDDLQTGLRAKGYYNATVKIGRLGEEGQPPMFDIVTGPLYTISEIVTENMPDSIELPVKIDDRLDAQSVIDAQKYLFSQMQENYCYYNLDVQHKVFLDDKDATAKLVFIVHGQPDARFGETTMTGADDIERTYLREFLTYGQGDCWKRTLVNDTESALYATELLASVRTNLPETLPEDGIVPINMTLKQSTFHSIKLGGGFNSSDGAGIVTEWENRNLSGEGERLAFRARLYAAVQKITGIFAKPFFLRNDQSLRVETTLNNENNEAFKDRSVTLTGTVTRQMNDETAIAVGAAYELSRIEDEQGFRNYGLFSLPLSIRRDTRDNILNPSEGLTLDVGLTPFFDTLGESNPFIKSRITGTTYFDMADMALDPVLALRASYGAIYGTEITDVPANKRFYAGGGGSVRGFAYQDLGPREADGDAAGGLSIVELTGELRLRVTESFGAVAFVDAGQVYESTTPDFSNDLAVGAGAGVRYYTDFGPLRFDVATPVTKRDRSDDAFQIYLSIGQAF